MIPAQGHTTNWTFVPKGTPESEKVRSEKVRWGYRFGFNGQEKVDEVNGSVGTHNTAEFWEYDTRTGRRWNLDPVDQISISNYAAFGLNPIINVDPNGAWFWESKNVRQARQVSRATGGEFEKHKNSEGKMDASVTLSGVTTDEEGEAFTVARYGFRHGQDRSDLVDAAGGDFYDKMQANSTGLDVAKWSLLALDDATKPGRTPPAAIQAFLSLNPIVSAANAATGFGSGQNVWGQEQSALGTGASVLGAIPGFGLLGGAGKAAPRVIAGFTQHAAVTATVRGFQTKSILQIVREGEVISATGRFGPQLKYTLGGNTVVLNQNAKVVTMFSTAPGTRLGLGRGTFLPFE